MAVENTDQVQDHPKIHRRSPEVAVHRCFSSSSAIMEVVRVETHSSSRIASVLPISQDADLSMFTSVLRANQDKVCVKHAEHSPEVTLPLFFNELALPHSFVNLSTMCIHV